jgi:S1-C subfamily serine protease
MMPQARSRGRTIRLLGLGLIIGLAAYWIGTRYGRQESPAVGAVPSLTAVSGPYKFDPTELENIRIYKAAAPAVANIVTRAVQYDFFYNPVPVEGAGSGFVIDAQGHILTDYHVVQDAQTIEVTLGDSSRYKARFVGADPNNDIALLQIDPRGHKLTVLPLGDSRNLLVGQRVLAIGNPFGFQSTLTTGVISSLGRTVQTDESFIDEAIQTDAAINRGNSGGPLLDSQGQVIGINSAIVSPSGANAGIGFAIPINTARRVAEQLIAHGRVLRATLGVEGLPLWPDLADALQLGVKQGVLVQQVSAGSAAAAAGIRAGNRTVLAGLQEIRIGGDVIVGVNGTAVTNQADLNLLLNRAQPGDTVTLTIVRAGKKMSVPVKLGEGS